MLRFGPYRPPRVRIGRVVECEHLGETLQRAVRQELELLEVVVVTINR
jgi:hypothetical protein